MGMRSSNKGWNRKASRGTATFVLLAMPNSAPSALLSDGGTDKLVLHRELLLERTCSALERAGAGRGGAGAHTSAQPGGAAGFHFCSLSSCVPR